MTSVLLGVTLGGLLHIVLDKSGGLVEGTNTLANIEDFPFIVSIQKNEIHFCGGSVVYRNLVLTGCHCVSKRSKTTGILEYKHITNITLRAGSLNPLSGGESHQAYSFFRHPKCDWDATGWTFDLGIVKVDADFSIKRKQLEILPLPDRRSPGLLEELARERTDCVSVEWSKFEKQRTSGSKVLLKVYLELLTQSQCEKIFRQNSNRYRNSTHKNKELRSSQVCALGTNGDDACAGDSGGPFLCNDGFSERLALFGVLSWEVGCGKLGIPGVSTRVDTAISWIKHLMTEEADQREEEELRIHIKEKQQIFIDKTIQDWLSKFGVTTIIHSSDMNDFYPRIAGGERASIAQFPFMVAIFHKQKLECGGSLLTTMHVLTACHCVVIAMEAVLDDKNIPPKNYREMYLEAGSERQNEGLWRSAKRVMKHPECVRTVKSWIYDVGMVVSKRKFLLTRGKIELLPLPSFHDISLREMATNGTNCVTAGWGRIKEKGKKSPYLMKLSLKLLDFDICNEQMEIEGNKLETELRFQEESQICTVGLDGKDTCTGDSGGPLICPNPSGAARILCGVVSWGIGCGRGIPGVWARLDVALPWIQTTLTSGTRSEQFMSLATIFQIMSLVNFMRPSHC
ncbi:hypothetical protein GE061_018984 [Apolygus lucorum]|uniref:Peptidase S1 domain-containing protein n=1 Tax=Apolygus lucorum TaxID=248454 RepID=A0A8S9X765_APOLU|nr:hypothetical protein GE061_018984 [Apolygus lucorum]